MTLILGMVCDDGVVIAADSKVAPHGGGKPSYGFKKITIVYGVVAVAIAGVGYLDTANKVLCDMVRGFLRLNPNIALDLIAKDMCKWCAEFLIAEESHFTVIVADCRDMYFIYARYHNGIAEAKYEKVPSTVAGIEDVKYLPYKGNNTTDEYGAYFRQIIRLNKGLHVGGRTQVVVLKNKTTV